MISDQYHHGINILFMFAAAYKLVEIKMHNIFDGIHKTSKTPQKTSIVWLIFNPLLLSQFGLKEFSITERLWQKSDNNNKKYFYIYTWSLGNLGQRLRWI